MEFNYGRTFSKLGAKRRDLIHMALFCFCWYQYVIRCRACHEIECIHVTACVANVRRDPIVLSGGAVD